MYAIASKIQNFINSQRGNAWSKLARAMTELTATIEKLDTLQKGFGIAMPQDGTQQQVVKVKSAFENDFEKRHVAFTSGKPS